MLDQSCSLLDLQRHMNQIYGKSNTDFTVEDIFVRLSESSAKLTEYADNAPAEANEFIKVLSWFFALVNKLDIDTQEAMLKRFPDVCPHCCSNSCICLRTHKLYSQNMYDLEEELEGKAQTLSNLNKLYPKDSRYSFTLDWYIESLSKIYPANDARWSVNKHYFPSKILREIGKLIQGYRRIKYAPAAADIQKITKSFAGDSADFLAWLLSFWRLTFRAEKKFMPQFQMIRRFGISCPYCNRTPCECSKTRRHGNGAETVTTPAELKNLINDQILVLLKEIGEGRSQSALVTELNSQETFKDRKALVKVLDKVKNLASGDSEFAGNAEKLVISVSRIFEILNRFS